jgi:hypothetical protein
MIHHFANFTGSRVNKASVISHHAKASIIESESPFVFFLASTNALFDSSSSTVSIFQYVCFNLWYSQALLQPLLIPLSNTLLIELLIESLIMLLICAFIALLETSFILGFLKKALNS